MRDREHEGRPLKQQSFVSAESVRLQPDRCQAIFHHVQNGNPRHSLTADARHAPVDSGNWRFVGRSNRCKGRNECRAYIRRMLWGLCHMEFAALSLQQRDGCMYWTSAESSRPPGRLFLWMRGASPCLLIELKQQHRSWTQKT